MVAILMMVPYTEIDWQAYMDEVKLCMNGERDYSVVSGGTGPLVYPAGFVWLFSGLRFITNGGSDVSLAQCIYAVVYLITLSFVLKLYRSAGVSLAATLPLFFSKRLRSVYMLRLFNDCWAVLLALMAVLRLSTIISTSTRSFKYRHWYWGCLLMSVAISVKMNILLFCPGLLCILVYSLPTAQVMICGAIGVAWQVLVALPFLLYAPESYFSRAFELRRVFQHRWSVNYQFLPVKVFEDSRFHIALFCSMIGCYVLLWRLRWRSRCMKAVAALKKREALSQLSSSTETETTPRFASTERKRQETRDGDKTEAPDHITDNNAVESTAETRAAKEREKMLLTGEVTCISHVLTLFESNIIGVAFSRSMHYQFLPWFFFTVMFVLFHTRLPTAISLVLLWGVQYGFEVYPPTPLSSMFVMIGFTGIVAATLFLAREPGSRKAMNETECKGEHKSRAETKPVDETVDTCDKNAGSTAHSEE